MKFLPKGRLDAFADGVFAIVITLLVLDLTVPEVSVGVISGLMKEWPVFLAYLISFAFIGSAWISHSSLTHLMKRETTYSYRLTLLLLFFVSLLPFTTKLMATYLGNLPIPVTIYGLDLPALSVTVNAIMRSAISTPVTIYGLNLLATMLTFIAIIRSAISTPEILVDESAKSELHIMLRREKFGVFIILSTVILAVFFPLIAVFGYIVVSILFFLTPTISVAKTTLKKR
jgi:TMEM175 potassium channel family protein